MSSTSVAVGCAVGIPIGLGIVVAFIFWLRLQRRFKKEDGQDTELDKAVYGDEGYINFDNLATIQDEPTTRNNTRKSLEDENVLESMTKEKGTTGKYFVPAYRRKVNKISQNALSDVALPNNESTVSIDSTQQLSKRHFSEYDRMVPIVAVDDEKLFMASSDSAVSTPGTEESTNAKRIASTENFLKSLQTQDYGSYPRRQSSSSIMHTAGGNISNASFHTRASSFNSVSKAADNAFQSPKKLQTIDVTISPYNHSNKPMSNNGDITEEDQYDNEFTNYSDSKREFIESLRPQTG